MFTALVILAYVFEILILALCVWRGYKLGVYKSLVRTVYLILIIPISILASNAIAHPVAKIAMDLVRSISNPTISSLVNSSPETFTLIEALVSALLFSIIFAILFGILELLSLIKFNAVATKITKKLDNPEKAKAIKLGGLGVGLLNGAISSAILLIPLCLVISLLGTSDSQALTALHVPTDEHVHREKTYYVNVPSSLLLKRVTQISDKDIPEEYSELKHMHVNFVEEGPNIINEAGYAINAYTYAHDHGKDNKESILSAIGAANAHDGNSKALPAIFANIIKKAVDAWEHGDTFLGIDLGFDNAFAKAFVAKTLEALKNVNTNNVHSIVDSLMGDGEHDGIMNNVFTLQKSTQANQDQSAVEVLKTNSDLVADTLVQLGQSNDLKSINTLVADIGSTYIADVMTNMVDSSNMSEDKIYDFADSVAEYTQNNIKTNDEEVSYEEHVEEISQMVINTASSYNYPISPSEATIVSVGLLSYATETPDEEISAEDLLEYFGYSASDFIG